VARQRSALRAGWSPAALGWRLQSLGVVPFRCSLAAEPDPARPAASDWWALLAEQEGWPGELERLEPQRWPAADPEPQPCDPFRSSQFGDGISADPGACISAGFADGLICSLPEVVPQGAFALQVGCRLDADHFQQVSLHYDSRQRLTAWELRRFRRP